MQPQDAFGPTAPAHPPPSVAPAKRPSPRVILAAASAGAALAVLLTGIAIGRCTKGGSVAAPGPSNPQQLSQLAVTSKPVDANVTVDGRFVGVSPVERIDLDPGKHSIVIDAFGYQPYAGTVEVEPKSRATLKVQLAPMGGSGATNGEVVGVKKASNAPVPPTALAPFSLTGTGASKEGAKDASKPSRPAASHRPSAPRRDCSGERSRCRESCSSTDFSCTSRCSGCGSCSTNWDECNRQCSTCKQGCEQNVRFCESSCESNYNNCSASQ
ncbi:MAG: PEGA domain-containing protein [Myxococcota bacterium]|nr:PEGA domain-containing protein [Myxococcota bacterium]